MMLYLDPAALKALKRYALDQNTKVHSLLLDAVESMVQEPRLARAGQGSDGAKKDGNRARRKEPVNFRAPAHYYAASRYW